MWNWTGESLYMKLEFGESYEIPHGGSSKLMANIYVFRQEVLLKHSMHLKEEVLTKPTVLACINCEAETKISVNASPHRLGAEDFT